MALNVLLKTVLKWYKLYVCKLFIIRSLDPLLLSGTKGYILFKISWLFFVLTGDETKSDQKMCNNWLHCVVGK